MKEQWFNIRDPFYREQSNVCVILLIFCEGGCSINEWHFQAEDPALLVQFVEVYTPGCLVELIG